MTDFTCSHGETRNVHEPNRCLKCYQGTVDFLTLAGVEMETTTKTPERKTVATVTQSFARRFILNRSEDPTGTSGTGTVAEGVMFSGGKVALHWFSHYGAVNVYDSIEVVRVLHGHGKATCIEWLDKEEE